MYEGAQFPPPLLRTADAGRYLGLSGETFEKYRGHGAGQSTGKLVVGRPT
jgi:hypothetical protein